MIVRVDEAGKHEAAIEIDHLVAPVGRDVNAVDAAVLDAQGSSQPAAGHDDLRIHERQGSTPEQPTIRSTAVTTTVPRWFGPHAPPGPRVVPAHPQAPARATPRSRIRPPRMPGGADRASARSRRSS